MMKITNALFFVMCLVTSATGHLHSALKEDLERQLIINKSHVKSSIQTKSGYIVDCVDINKQPAFNHPLLKNHKLQRKPSFERKINETSVNVWPTKLIYGLEKVRCPRESVPIRRITKDDLIRRKSLFNNHSLIDSSVSHRAYVYVVKTYTYAGVTGVTSIYNPKVSKGQSSASYLYVENDHNDKIMVGWHVYPELYNDDDSTYFFSQWTSGNSKNGGCFNMLCSGFIQTDTSFYLGSRIAKTSTYDGEMIEMPISLNMDSSHNWWLTVVNKTIGYFPAALFSNLITSIRVGWGGETYNLVGASSPPMGSGHFPDENFVHGCYFRNVGYQIHASGIYYPPRGIEAVVFAHKCYDVDYYGDQGEEFGYSLQFGGPGGDNCGNLL